VNSVRWTPEGRRSLIALLSVTECPYLCASHFLPSDFNHDSSHNDVRPDAVPLFVLIGHSHFQEPSKCAKAEGAPIIKVSNAIKKELVEIKDEPIDEFAEIKQKELIGKIYCPSTGTSRPIDHSSLIKINRSDESDKQYMCPECGKK
ncbi:hypothetical protein PMAYCL1PPCAC_20055, partial [Pristionchus mayeri]